MMPSKKKKKEEAQPLAAVDASTMVHSSVVSCDANIIEETTEEVKVVEQPKGKKKKMDTKNEGGLSMASTVPDLSIKIYEEQLPDGIDKLFETIRSIDPKDFWVLAIIHDKDVVTDDLFVEAYKKLHIHILAIKQGKDEDGRTLRRKVSTILNMLGVVFRPGLDDAIWKKKGVERIAHIGNMTAYLTHETEAAQQEGKELYPRSAIVSNLTPEEIDQVRDGYIRLSKSKNKASIDEQIEFLDAAVNAGLTGSMTFEEFEASLPFVLKKGATYNLYKTKYFEAVDRRMEGRTDILRLAVFIQGDFNQGKTHAAQHAFDNTGLRVLKIGDGGRTGKTDSLTENHDVLILDDAVVQDLLGMADNNAVKVYRRNGNNPYWCGSYFIVTSNLTFEEWARRCGVNDKHQLAAARSRFYMCQVVEDDAGKFLDCVEVSKRGTAEQQRKRLDMFIKFRDAFNSIIREYRPSEVEVDYSAVLSKKNEEPHDLPKGWFCSSVDKNGQCKIGDPSDCLPFG